MLNLAEVADKLENYDGDFLSSLREKKTGKDLWSDVYFYVIGDPMKQKTNKLRTYIKEQLDIKNSPVTKARNYNNHHHLTSIKRKSTKKVHFHDINSINSRKSVLKTHRDLELSKIEDEVRLFELLPSKTPKKSMPKPLNFDINYDIIKPKRAFKSVVTKSFANRYKSPRELPLTENEKSRKK